MIFFFFFFNFFGSSITPIPTCLKAAAVSVFDILNPKYQSHWGMTAFNIRPCPLTFCRADAILSWNEVIVLSRMKFKSSRGGGKWTKRQGEKFRLVGGIAEGDNFSVLRWRHSTLFVFVFRHIVNNPLFCQTYGHTSVVKRANNIGLLVQVPFSLCFECLCHCMLGESKNF